MKRKQFIAQTLGLTAAFASLRLGWGDGTNQEISFGPLQKDPMGIIDLPAGYEYKVISRSGDPMSDALPTPARPDGMAAFGGQQGQPIVLVRNHENDPQFLEADHPWNHIPKSKFYDAGFGKSPAMGGTSTLIYDPKSRELIQHFLSLAGTVRNCAGGPTPWGSWISCEESNLKVSEICEKDHGYCFEVPAHPNTGIVDPIPLKGMGRFNHEAVAVDSRTGIVYMTEDRMDGLFYRFIPHVMGHLELGGRLQALMLRDIPQALTHNHQEHGKNIGMHMVIGQKYLCTWVDLDQVQSPNDDLRIQGHSKGAAIFCRGEGIWFNRDQMLFTATAGGQNRCGQVFRYEPIPYGPLSKHDGIDGTLELFLEPNDREVLDYGDNITFHPNGDVMICEDGNEGNFIRHVSAKGEIKPFAYNAFNKSEFAGACFSPDGKVFFVNIQDPGLTLAIHGPF
jgi:uncharacterized protein